MTFTLREIDIDLKSYIDARVRSLTDGVRVKIESSNYNPNIDNTVTLTITVLNNLNEPVSNYGIQLYLNGTSLGNSYKANTNSNGRVTFNYTLNKYGMYTFTVNGGVGGTNLQLRPRGWKTYFNNASYNITFNEDFIRLNTTITSSFTAETHVKTFNTAIFNDEWVRPTKNLLTPCADGTVIGVISSSGTKLGYKSSNYFESTQSGLQNTFLWRHRGLPSTYKL